MKLYNKGGRAIIIAKSEAISGCRIPTDTIGAEKAYIDPGKTVEVVDSKGEKLMNMYPELLVRMDEKAKTKAKAKAKKPVAKPAAKKKR